MAAPADLTRPLILIIEDDPDAGRIAEGMLRSLGCRTTLAEDALEGLFKLRDERPTLILLDISLPDIDGAGFVDMARGVPEAAGVPIIVASAHYAADSDMTRSLRERGVRRYLRKPFGTAQLENALRQVLVGWEPTEPDSGEVDTTGSTVEFEALDIGRSVTPKPQPAPAVPDAKPGQLIGPLTAAILRDDSRLDVQIEVVQAETVVIQCSQLQPRPGDLVRLELAARRAGANGEIEFVSVQLLTRATTVQKRGVAWQVALVVHAARPETLWPALGALFRG